MGYLKILINGYIFELKENLKKEKSLIAQVVIKKRIKALKVM
jgi:hypothetical protein